MDFSDGIGHSTQRGTKESFIRGWSMESTVNEGFPRPMDSTVPREVAKYDLRKMIQRGRFRVDPTWGPSSPIQALKSWAP